QHGEIQPIGGATDKIEGFFDICKLKGLTGNQGVIIPIQNVDDLMLKEEVLGAVEKEQFHVYSIKNVEEGIELLTGLPAGELKDDGTYTDGSVFQKVQEKINQYTEHLQHTLPYPHMLNQQNEK